MNSVLPVRVAVGVIYNSLGEILLTKRSSAQHQGGLWEFPGGKCGFGETIEQTLSRELSEELGITVDTVRPLIEIRHDYGDVKVELVVFLVENFSGIASGLEEQPLKWVKPYELANYPLPQANAAILKAITLPSRYWITQPTYASSHLLMDAVKKSIGQGISLVQLRLKNLTDKEYFYLAEKVVQLCHEQQVAIYVNGSLDMVKATNATGIHLNSQQLAQYQNIAVFDGLKVAASCHNLEQLKQAEQLDVDFAVLSAVLPTLSHPIGKPIGWGLFTQWVSTINVPVYALGGMTSDMLDESWQYGAQGVAGIRGLVAL